MKPDITYSPIGVIHSEHTDRNGWHEDVTENDAHVRGKRSYPSELRT